VRVHDEQAIRRYWAVPESCDATGQERAERINVRHLGAYRHQHHFGRRRVQLGQSGAHRCAKWITLAAAVAAAATTRAPRHRVVAAQVEFEPKIEAKL